MSVPVGYVRRIVLLVLLPFATLGGAVAAGRMEVRMAGPGDCLAALGEPTATTNALVQCAAPTASIATLFAGALLAALVVSYATVELSRLLRATTP